ncbi:MAG: hypothetical protein LBR52_02190 [Prevotellaceae bacterium]|jgi:hypothetical protein|nr:hypothetical protein [Prevotellaceae bacterium]
METNTSNYQEKEALGNKSKSKSDLLYSGGKHAPVQMVETKKTDRHPAEEELESSIETINPDEISMNSRG